MAKKKKKKKKLVKGFWSKSEVNLLKKLFSNNPTAEIAAELGRPTNRLHSMYSFSVAERGGMFRRRRCAQ